MTGTGATLMDETGKGHGDRGEAQQGTDAVRIALALIGLIGAAAVMAANMG